MESLSSPDVAQRYGIPLRTVQAACASGAIKACRFGRMWLIPPEEAAAYAEAWRPRNGKEHPVENDYALAEETVVRQDLTPGQAVWKVDNSNGQRRRVLNPSGLVGFDEYQPRAWQEVKELFDVSRLSAPETPNGPGSTVALTEGIRSWLPELFARYDIASMLDAPCGDWNWFRLVDLGRIEYLGWDVVPELVEQCRQRIADRDHVPYRQGEVVRRDTDAGEAVWAAQASVVRRDSDRGAVWSTENPVSPNVTFDCVNLLTVESVPRVDLILSRDFLAHLPNEAALKVVGKFTASGSKYLLTSHYPGADNEFVYDPKDYAWIGYAERPINLTAEPFSLGDPIESFPEAAGPAGVIANPHELALFEL